MLQAPCSVARLARRCSGRGVGTLGEAVEVLQHGERLRHVADLKARGPQEEAAHELLGRGTAAAAAAIASGGVPEYELSIMSTVLSQIRHEYDLRGWTEVRVFLTRMPAFVGPFAMRCMEFLQRL